MSNTLTAPRQRSLGSIFAIMAAAAAVDDFGAVKSIRTSLREAGLRGSLLSSPPTKNQRKIRKARRARWAAGDRRAFS